MRKSLRMSMRGEKNRLATVSRCTVGRIVETSEETGRSALAMARSKQRRLVGRIRPRLMTGLAAVEKAEEMQGRTVAADAKLIHKIHRSPDMDLLLGS